MGIISGVTGLLSFFIRNDVTNISVEVGVMGSQRLEFLNTPMNPILFKRLSWSPVI